MARAGILYSQVAQAAAKLLEDGKNPTVDSVREALGSTGSKSTIAPLLKRWKAERQDVIAEAESGLPAPLLQAVKGLHQYMQAEASEQIAQAQQAHDAALEVAAERERQVRAEHEATLAAHAAAAEELAQAKDTLAQLRTMHQAQAVTLATVQADNAGLQQRLADRAAEVATLDQQLTQARVQFEHYQTATATQRAEERQQAEQSRLRLESELTEARQNVAVQRAAIAQRELDMTRLQQDKDRLATELASLQAAYTTLQAEHRHHAQQIQASEVLHTELRAQVETTSGALVQTRSELVILSAEKPQFQSRIAALEAEVQSLLDENKTLTIDKARLEGMHSRPAAQPSTA